MIRDNFNSISLDEQTFEERFDRIQTRVAIVTGLIKIIADASPEILPSEEETLVDAVVSFHGQLEQLERSDK